MNPNGFFDGVPSTQSFCDPYAAAAAASMMKGQLINQYAGGFLIPGYQEQMPHPSYYGGPMHVDAMGLQGQNTSGPVPWNHSIPLCVPWFQQNSPFPTQNEIYEIGAQMPNRVVPCKRKGVHFDEAPSACKQYISEEVMAAKMDQLHISNNYSTKTMDPSSCAQTITDDCSFGRQPATTLEELEARLVEDGGDIEFESNFSLSNNNNNEMDRVVVLSPELKKLEADPIIPKSILEKIQKPSMELVLWKPPGGAIGQFIEATLTKKRDDEVDDSTDESLTTNRSHWQNANTNSLSKRSLLPDEQLGEDMVC